MHKSQSNHHRILLTGAAQTNEDVMLADLSDSACLLASMKDVDAVV